MNARRTESRTGYTVRGRSLDALVKDIAQKCPKDPSGVRRTAGGCSVEIKHDLDDKDLKFETKAGSSPCEVKATLTGGTMLCECQIIVPKLASEKDLKPPALKEWKRFRLAVEKHAQGLSNAYLKLAQTLASEVTVVSAVGKEKDEKAAKAEARKAVEAILDKKYDKPAIAARIKLAAKLYNAKTKNGAAKGATLDTKIAG